MGGWVEREKGRGKMCCKGGWKGGRESAVGSIERDVFTVLLER